MMDAVDNVKKVSGESVGLISEELGLAARSMMRWRGRRGRGEELAGKPGPGKVGSFGFDMLCQRICQLAHGRKRTRNTGALYAQYKSKVSRRVFQALLKRVRMEVLGRERALDRRIEWKVAGMVWAMDDADVNPVGRSDHGHIHVVHDLGSQYILRILGDEDLADGWKVAANLEELFIQHRPPLILKMDNGSNLNHHAVLSVLDKYGVIPLNSPAHYPPYNGAIEHKQGEIKTELLYQIGGGRVSTRELRLASALCGHELNHKPRRQLKGRNAYDVLLAGRPDVRQFNRRKRKEAFDEIVELVVDILACLQENKKDIVNTAFRYAVETWLQLNNIINVTRNGKVLPTFYGI